MSRNLTLLPSNEENISHVSKIDFGHSYYNTSIVRTAVLYNNCPTNTNFVIILAPERNGSGIHVARFGNPAALLATSESGYPVNLEHGDSLDNSHIISVTPHEGTLQPFEKRKIIFIFSPVFVLNDLGWLHNREKPYKREYTMSLHFLPANPSVTTEHEGKMIEVAVKAIAEPVELELSENHLDLGVCVMNKSCTIQTGLTNQSSMLPIHFTIPHVANLVVTPSSGRLGPGEKVALNISFTATSIGNIEKSLTIQAIGTKKRIPLAKFEHKIIHKLLLKITANCKMPPRPPTPLTSMKATLNHLPRSIKPHDRTILIHTPFTHQERYTYTDYDYTQTEEEILARKIHRDRYVSYLRESQLRRHDLARDFNLRRFINTQDLGIEPFSGIVPPVVKPPRTTHFISKEAPNQTIKTEFEISGGFTTFLDELDLLKSPITTQQKKTVKIPLTPEELISVKVFPTNLHFGEVTINSHLQKQVSIVNNNKKMLMFTVNGDTNFFYAPKNLLIPGESETTLSLEFTATKTGCYEQGISFLINNTHENHFLLNAEAVNPYLMIQPGTITLIPPLYSSISTGLRQTLRLVNPLNTQIEFNWEFEAPLPEYVIYPTQGVVPPYGEIQCVAFCVPHYDTTENVSATLFTKNGRDSVLNLKLDPGKHDSTFLERRVLFGDIPNNLNCIQHCNVYNPGPNNAYFKVECSFEYLGIHVSPSHGIVPTGGVVKLDVEINAAKVGRFDVPLTLRFKQGDSISIRASGNIVRPVVEADIPIFNFGGVYCGTKTTLPFSLTNKSQVLARLTFDFIHRKDFSLSTLKSSENSIFLNRQPNLPPFIFTLDIPPKTTLKCKLTFAAREVASYDFTLPIFVNSESVPSPPISPWPPSSDSQIFYLPKIPDIPTPSRRILATSLETPLTVSKLEITFTEPELYLQTALVLPTNYKELQIQNHSKGKMQFLTKIKSPKNIENCVFSLFDTSLMPIDTSQPIEILPNGTNTFLVAFTPTTLSNFESQLFIFLPEELSKPFATISLTGRVISPEISVTNTQLILTNIPLNIPIKHSVTCQMIGYSSADFLYCEMPFLPESVSMVMEGVRQTNFENKIRIGTIQPCLDIPLVISVAITVTGTESISLTESLVFSDNCGTECVLPLSLSIDNCVFSLYRFLSSQSGPLNLQIDPESGVPQFVPHSDTKPLPHSNTSQTIPKTSTLFSQLEIIDHEAVFIEDVKSAVCRWLTYHGWPKHYFPIQCPEVLGTQDCSSGPFSLSIGRYRSKGILEIIQHLWGKPIPDVPVNTLIHYPEDERIVYKYQMVTAILAVLQVHGAHLPHVTPQVLLVQEEYILWFQKVHLCQPDSSELERFREDSSRAWIDILLQAMKVFVLAKVTISNKFIGKQSNIYSQQELTLLEWLNNNFQTSKHLLNDMTGENLLDRTVSSFVLDLIDGVVLACTLLKYVPLLRRTLLKRLYLQPLTPEHCLHNASRIIESLQSIRFDFEVNVSDLIMPNPIFMVLFCTHMFLRLPAYLPKRDIEFEGTLAPNTTFVTYKIKIENPSQKTLVYSAIMKGVDRDFFTLPSGTMVKVSPKGVAHFPVSYVVQFVSVKRAMLLLVGDPGTNHGSVLSFNLIGRVTKITPLKIEKIRSLLYQKQELSLPIDKTGTETYKIQIFEADGNLSSEKQANNIPIELFEKSCNPEVNKFHIDGEVLTLNSHGSSCLLVTFIPFYIGTRFCLVLFSNSEKGQFVVAVESHISYPLPTVVPFATKDGSNRISTNQASAFGISDANDETFLTKSAIGQVTNEDLTVSSENMALEEALYCLARHNMSDDEYKYRILTDTMQQATLEIATRALNISTQPVNNDNKQFVDPKMTFTISSNSENFTFPPTLTLPPNQSADLAFQFTASVAGQYKCRVVLKNSNETRIYQILSLVVPSENHPIIEIECPALKNINQQIPIANPSKKEWNLDVVLKGVGYHGPSVFTIRALETAFYPLNFRPTIPGHFSGEVEMVNRETGTEHHFSIIGRSLVPDSMGEIVISCRVGEQQTCAITVPNYSERTANFKANTNLEFSSGHSYFSVDPNSIITYELLISPKHRGTFSGTVVFVADAPLGHVSPRFNNVDHPDGTTHRVWYTIKVFVSPGPPRDTIQVSKPLFTNNIIGVNFQNQRTQSGFIAALCVDGEGLTGPAELNLTPLEKCVINLTYSPLRKGTQVASVILTEEKGDEIWYKLELTGTDPEPIIVPDIESPLGLEATHKVLLFNPLDIQSVFSWELNRTGHFFVFNQPKNILVLPRSELEITVGFKASTIGEGNHFTTLKFVSPDLGTLSYHLKGVGLPPGEMEATNIYSDIGSNAAKIVCFQNPLDIKIILDLFFTENASDTMSILLTNTTRIPISPHGNLDIPIRFKPIDMREVIHTLAITTNTQLREQPLVWSFPIFGHPCTLPIQFSDAPILQSASRVRSEVCLILRPNKCVDKATLFASPTLSTHSAIQESPAQVENVKFRMTPQTNMKQILNRSLGVKFIGAYKDGGNEDTNLAFNLIYFPFKAMKINCVLEVEFSGCVWRMALKFHSTHPQPDDVIRIRAKQIGGTATCVSFNLNSGCDEATSFRAYLDRKSDPAFAISPQSGILPAKGNQNQTKITVNFRPVKYRSECEGLVVIETENMLWTYKLIGDTHSKSEHDTISGHIILPQIVSP